jgi:hypothetical protein
MRPERKECQPEANHAVNGAAAKVIADLGLEIAGPAAQCGFKLEVVGSLRQNFRHAGLAKTSAP